MASDLEHKILICADCGEEFIFTVGAQEYFAEKGYTEDPKRCKHCYMLHKRGKENNQSVGAVDQMTPNLPQMNGNDSRFPN